MRNHLFVLIYVLCCISISYMFCGCSSCSLYDEEFSSIKDRNGIKEENIYGDYQYKGEAGTYTVLIRKHLYKIHIEWNKGGQYESTWYPCSIFFKDKWWVDFCEWPKSTMRDEVDMTSWPGYTKDEIEKGEYISLMSVIGKNKNNELAFKCRSDEPEIWYIKRKESNGIPENESSEEILIKLLNNKSFSIRVGAIQELLKGYYKSAVPAIIIALNDEDDIVRKQAVIALVKMEIKSAIPEFIELLKKEQSDRVISEIFKSLKILTNQDFGPDQAKWRAWWEANKARILKEEAEKDKAGKE